MPATLNNAGVIACHEWDESTILAACGVVSADWLPLYSSAGIVGLRIYTGSIEGAPLLQCVKPLLFCAAVRGG